jgi:hypothetical protein
MLQVDGLGWAADIIEDALKIRQEAPLPGEPVLVRDLG